MTSPLDQIPRLAALLAETGIDELELSGPAGRVLLRRSGVAVSAASPPSGASLPSDAPAHPSPTETVVVTSPGIGAFRRAHPLHDQPLVDEGDPVAAGQLLGLLQIGALLQPVRAPADGVVAAIRAADGALTGFGDPLFDLLPH